MGDPKNIFQKMLKMPTRPTRHSTKGLIPVISLYVFSLSPFYPIQTLPTRPYTVHHLGSNPQYLPYG